MRIATTSTQRCTLACTGSLVRSTRWPSWAVAFALAACANAPQAAVAEHAVDAVVTPMSASAPDTSVCHSETAAPALKTIEMELKAHGMALKTACQSGSGDLQVQLKVIDGMKATQWVRGPLADGHDVDMGTPSGAVVPGAAADARHFSPDVLHNRVWLNKLMARHQFVNQPDAWWHFSPNRSAMGDRATTDLASR